jgi:hypothetical protein
MNLQQQEILTQKSKRLSDALDNISEKEGKNIFSFLWKGLEQDEQLLIKLMNAFAPHPGPYPSPKDPGNIEYGWGLYFLNVILPVKLPVLGKTLKNTLTKVFGMPNTGISKTEWSDWEKTWNSSGVVMGDGSLVSTQKYAIMDMGWAWAVIDFIELYIKYKPIAPFRVHPNTVKIDSNTKTNLRIAIIGDWGTGNYQDGPSKNSPAVQIMQQIEKMAPDMLIHLGDVYYAGSKKQEQENLLDQWTYNAPLGNFTMNSNHEMYDGAEAYYNTALASSLFTPYQSSKDPNTGKEYPPCSYFSIEYGDYIILGMDSAYNATGMYLDGRITNTDQLNFMNQADSKGKKIVLMTHHNPIDTLGEAPNKLWTDVTASNGLNNPPYMWYWGHIHNGIVYNNKAASGNTLARCLGNSSIPIGTGRWLKNNYIDYFTNTPLNDGDPDHKLRVKNGFAMLTVTSNSIEETWYDQSGNACWTQKNT